MTELQADTMISLLQFISAAVILLFCFSEVRLR